MWPIVIERIYSTISPHSRGRRVLPYRPTKFLPFFYILHFPFSLPYDVDKNKNIPAFLKNSSWFYDLLAFMYESVTSIPLAWICLFFVKRDFRFVRCGFGWVFWKIKQFATWRRVAADQHSSDADRRGIWAGCLPPTDRIHSHRLCYAPAANFAR